MTTLTNKKIFVVNGFPGVGKDYFIDNAIEILKLKDGTCLVGKYSTVDSIKVAAKLFGWDGEKTLKARKFLSDLKNLTTDFNDFSLEEIKAKIIAASHEFYFILAREPLEIQKLKDFAEEKNISFVSILITRKLLKTPMFETEFKNLGNETSYSCFLKNHLTPADLDVMSFNYDLIIDNTEENFIKSISYFCESL